MSEAMDIDSGYDSRNRDASPRRDRPEHRDRSPRRTRGDSFRDRRSDYRDSRGGRDYRDSRGYRDTRPPRDINERSKTDRNYSNSVFIGNIPFDCESRHLRELFSKVGKVIRADVVTQNGRHRGMATVEFSSTDEVNRAIQDFDHSQFMNREIFVRQDNPPPEDRRERGYGRDRGSRYDDRSYGRRDEGRDFGRRDEYRRDDRRRGDDYASRRDEYRRDDRRRGDDYASRREERPSRTGPLFEVFVGNLPFSINWQALKDIFREAGNVIRADVREDYNGRSRGFGTVEFDSPEGVQAAIEKFNRHEIEGRTIDVREGKNNTSDSSRDNFNSDKAEILISKKNSEFVQSVAGGGPQSDTIYVDNLPYATTNEDLNDLFESIGRVARAEIVFGHDDRPAGKAVVQFESEEFAEGAVQRLNNYEYGDRALNISYAQRN